MSTCKGRPGFMLYHEDVSALQTLDDASFGMLIRALAVYSESGETPTLADKLTALAFSVLRQKVDRDEAHYAHIVEKRRAAGIKSAESKKSQSMSTNAANVAVVDTDQQRQPTVNGNGNVNSFSAIPTVDDVEAFARSVGLHVDAEQFVREQELRGWRDSNGKPLRDWRSWLRGYVGLHPESVKPAIDPGPFF